MDLKNIDILQIEKILNFNNLQMDMGVQDFDIDENNQILIKIYQIKDTNTIKNDLETSVQSIQDLFFVESVSISMDNVIVLTIDSNYNKSTSKQLSESTSMSNLYDNWYREILNEDGDGGGMDGGESISTTPSNTPGMGDPSPGSMTEMGSGDLWGNMFGLRTTRKKRKPRKKKRNNKKEK